MMLPLHRNKLVLAFLIFLLMPHSAFASLLIAPTRVSFDERARASKVHLVNTSNKTNTYRLHWVQQKQTPNGKYKKISDDLKTFPTASHMIRFSPRQVTLKPSERQTIRLMLRRKPNLKTGDYRSHLVFQKLPDPDNIGAAPQKGARFQIKVNLGFSIPVIVRQGKFQSKAKIDGFHMLELEKNGKKSFGISIRLSRRGPNSVYGTIKVLWKPVASKKYTQVAILNNVAIYPELSKRNVKLGINTFAKRTSGYIKIIYQGSNDLERITFDEIEREINSNEYRKISPDAIN